MRSVSMDGRDFFLFRTMPCDFGSYLMAKFAALTLVGRGPVVVLLLVAFLVLGLPPVTLLAMLAFFALATMTCDLLALVIGARKPKLGWASESELSSSGEALVLLLLSLVLSLLVMALPLACAIVPLVLGLDAGVLPILGGARAAGNRVPGHPRLHLWPRDQVACNHRAVAPALLAVHLSPVAVCR